MSEPVSEHPHSKETFPNFFLKSLIFFTYKIHLVHLEFHLQVSSTKRTHH